nr:MarR family transcriptional regulator [Streptomyces sp. SM11]
MAKPGYGERTAPDQLPRTRHDFALLPTRERYVAGFVDHLPEGAAMSVKQLAKQLPLYGQQAISTALTALSVAGHLRRVRSSVGDGDETRWVFRTFWSRTARDNEWWNTYLATENTQATCPAAQVAASGAAAPPPPWAPADAPPPPAPPQAPRGEAVRETPEPPHADAAPDHAEPAESPAAISVPEQRAAYAPDLDPGTAQAAPHSPAYLALARLGRRDHRLALSADDCAALEAQAAEWLARGVDADYLTAALTAGLPARVDSPVGFVRRRLADKIPPRLPTEQAPPAPARRVLVECTECGAPGRPEALPDGLCRPCRADHRPGTGGGGGGGATPPHLTEAPADAAPCVGAYIAGLRDLLKSP